MTGAPGPSGPTTRSATYTESRHFCLPLGGNCDVSSLQTPDPPDLAHLGGDEDHQDERGGQLCSGQEGNGRGETAQVRQERIVLL